MELQFYGANCLKITTKKASIVVDDNLDRLGLKSITKPQDILLRTNSSIPIRKDARFTASIPGEYEISGVSIKGIGARGHMDEEGQRNSVIYTISGEDIKVVIVGHIFPELSEDQLEEIGMVDVAVIPVGGNGYTLDGAGALSIIKKIEPKIVIPTHYADKTIHYEVPQTSLEDALKDTGMEPAEKVAKYRVKPAELADSTTLLVLEKQ